MRKLLFGVLALFSLLLLVGCGNDNKVEDNSLNFWVYEPQSMAHKREYEALIKSFEEENDVKVRVSWIVKDSFNQRLNQAVLSSRTPDLSYLDQPVMATYLKNDLIVDVTTKVNESQTVKVSDFFDAAIDTVTFDQKLYGLPLTIGTSVMLYNKDHIQAPEDIKSWADMINISRDLSTGDLAAFEGVSAGGYAGWYFGGFLKAAGSDLMNEDLTEINFANDDAVAALEYLRELYSMSPESIRNSQNPFGNGKALFKLGGGSDIDSLRVNFPNLKFGAILMPPRLEGGTSYSSVGGDNLVIFKNSKKQDLAFKLIEYLTSSANALKIAEFTGNFPANNSAIGNAYDDDAERLVLREQLKTAVPRPKIDGWITINDSSLGAAIEDILTTNINIKERLEQAKKEAEAVLFKK